MGSPHYTPTGEPKQRKTAFGQTMRNEFDAIEDGIAEMALVPLVTHYENAAQYTNDNTYMAIPFDLTVKKVIMVNSAQMPVAQFPFWFRDESGGAFSQLTMLTLSAPETVVIDEGDEIDDDHSSFLAGQQMRIQIQGDSGVSNVPIYVTFLVQID
jgi:hypothetical protein